MFSMTKKTGGAGGDNQDQNPEGNAASLIITKDSNAYKLTATFLFFKLFPFYVYFLIFGVLLLGIGFLMTV